MVILEKLVLVFDGYCAVIVVVLVWTLILLFEVVIVYHQPVI
jgi:hypothetical protein